MADDCDVPECRICLSGDGGELLDGVCACRGTQRYVHAECLATWQRMGISQGNWSHMRHCGICGARLDHRGLRAIGPPALAMAFLRSLPSFALARASFWVVVSSMLMNWTEYYFVEEWIRSEALMRRSEMPEPSFKEVLDATNTSAEERFAAHSAGDGDVFKNGAWWGKFHQAPFMNPTGASLALWNNSLILYGGWNDHRRATNDLWMTDMSLLLNQQMLSWTYVPYRSGGTPLPGTYGQSLTLIDDGSSSGRPSFLVFGGHTAGRYASPSDQWRVLTLTAIGAYSWNCGLAGGRAPLALAWHSATRIPPGFGRRSKRFSAGYVFVFGGSRSSGASGSTMIFDVRTKSWHKDPAWVSGRPPPRRTAHSATLVSPPRGSSGARAEAVVWVLGGTDGDPMPWSGRDLSDGLWSFDPSRLRWLPREPMPAGLLAARQHVALALPLGNVMFFGRAAAGQSPEMMVLRVANRSSAWSPQKTMFTVQVPGHNSTLPTNMTVDTIAPPALRGHAAVWTGAEALIYGGSTPAFAGEYNGMLIMRPV